MTEAKRFSDAPNPELGPLFDQHEGVDWLLAYVIGLAERGLSISATVIAQGQVITGTIIGGREYFELLAQAFAAANVNGEGGSEVLNSLASSVESFKDIYTESGQLPEGFVVKPMYLHLKDAKTIFGGSTTHGSTLYRIKLPDVSAFTLTNMS